MKKIFLVTILISANFNNLFCSLSNKKADHQKTESDSSFVLVNDDLDYEIVKIYGIENKPEEVIPSIFVMDQVQKNTLDSHSQDSLLRNTLETCSQDQLGWLCCNKLMTYLASFVTSLTESFSDDIHKKE